MFECDLIGLRLVFLGIPILGAVLLCIVLFLFMILKLSGIKATLENFARLVLLISIPVTLIGWGISEGSISDCDTLELRYIFFYTLIIGDILLVLYLLASFRLRKRGLKISKPTSVLAMLLFLVNAPGWVYAFRIHNVIPERNCEPPGFYPIHTCLEKINNGQTP